MNQSENVNKQEDDQRFTDEDQTFINEQTDDDKRFSNTVVDRQEQGGLEALLELDYRNKQEFLSSEEKSIFSEFIVICQIRKDKYISEQDPHLQFLMEKAVYKGVQKILIKAQKIQDKEQWQKEQQRLMRLFYSDMNIGYITSTGQLKSTVFIYVHQSIANSLDNRQINLNFNKEDLKIIANYFSIDERNKSSKSSPEFTSPILTKEKSEKEQFKQNSAGSKTISQNEGEVENQMKKSLPLCHQSNWLKQEFIKKDYFKKQFLILQKTNENELKSGVQIFFVYRIKDDQIYAVKKSQLASNVISFFDVFSTVNLSEITNDQRKIREAKILSKLNHPNVLTLYDWWIEEEESGYSLYLMSEFCSYPGLKHQTNDLLNYAYYYLNPMNCKEKIEQIKTIMLQIMDGLEYIHKRGIVHRDLKPENIFVTYGIDCQLQVMLADFDQGKDVRESKLSIITDEKLNDKDLNSIKSRNTINSGTSGYATANSQINKEYDKMDEFYALGVTLLHLILAFPGEPKNRNLYTNTFAISDISDVLLLFDSWAVKLVKNKHPEFNFQQYFHLMELAKALLEKKVKEHDHIRKIIQSW
ncbi:unnamed protein product [Paramecium sonneborni]|uniref:Protein kinase domain-containing protein n=1 Tax=Paramecium sonneborni TaxID=65129 RepID=A0A8S1RBU2_9CILI|nr:unnamed protein product [Paramecium sonneborni]